MKLLCIFGIIIGSMSMVFSELCEFKEDLMGNGKFNLAGKTDTKEECAQKVRGEYLDATGVSWRKSNGWCYVEFGSKLRKWVESSGSFGCLFDVTRAPAPIPPGNFPKDPIITTRAPAPTSPANSNCHLDASEKYSEIIGGSGLGKQNRFTGLRGGLSVHVASVEDCAEECNKHSECNTFTFWLQSTHDKKKGMCILKKGGYIKGWSHEWDWKRISGACFPKGSSMIFDPAALNKKCKETKKANYRLSNLPIRKFDGWKYPVWAPATELNCKLMCATNPKCVGVSGVTGGVTKNPFDDRRWCISCFGPLDKPFQPHELNSNPTGYSFAFKKENMP